MKIQYSSMIITGWIKPDVLIRTVSLLILAVLSEGYAERIISPGSDRDYGSGSSIHLFYYYPGGLPFTNGKERGLFLGQPNAFSRNDRGLVRFNLSPYLLRPYGLNKVSSATLFFNFLYADWYAPIVPREVEVVHLNYDACIFSGNDLINSNVKRAGSITVKPNRRVPVYTLDVTRFVNQDIMQGNMYISFRFRDVQAEGKDSPPGPVGLRMAEKYSLKIKD